MSLFDIIYSLVQKPLQNVVQGLPGILLLMLVAQLFWIIGIHGNQMIKPIREPLLIAAIAANTEAHAAGKPLPNIITMPFWDMYMSMGGSGVTINSLIPTAAKMTVSHSIQSPPIITIGINKIKAITAVIIRCFI